MQPESKSAKRMSPHSEPASATNSRETQEADDADPYSWNGTSNALLGFGIAIALIVVPSYVVLIELSPNNEEITPSALEPYGSKTSSSLSVTRGCKPCR